MLGIKWQPRTDGFGGELYRCFWQGIKSVVTADLDAVKNLLFEINDKKLNMYLIKGSAITDDEFYMHEMIERPYLDSVYHADSLPSQIEFLEEEFWQLY